MSELIIEGLRAEVAGKEVLSGIELRVRSGEVHVVMGPNGAGKSSLANVLMGRPGYRVLGGTVRLDGIDLLTLETWERAHAGLFLAPQDPVEIPGVPLRSVLAEGLAARGRTEELLALDARLAREVAEIGVRPALVERALNVDASGGEKKRLETLQLAVLEPSIAILDELDSGLDIDALRQIARRVEQAAHPADGSVGFGVLAVTHYTRLLEELRADAVHVLVGGRIVESGGPELADRLENDGYGAYEQANEGGPSALDALFAGP
jgi:Fe-S cluster assembly ATP-binding protein